jgi:vancomycin resistance protein VanJ
MTPTRLSVGHILGNAFVALVGAYGLSVTGFLLLRLLLGEGFWLVALFNNYAHLLFIPSVILVPLCLLLRRVRVILLLIPALLAFLLSYSVFFLPRGLQAAADATPLRLLSYNVLWNNTDLDAMGAIIAQADADIVALQELTFASAEYIQSHFGDTYAYVAFEPRYGTEGLGILSRYPILEEEFWQILHGHQRVVVDVNGERVTLYNTHPPIPVMALGSSSVAQRSLEIQDVLRRAEGDDGPLILIGDFNATDQSADYWHVASRYTDAYRAVGWGMGFTFPEFAIARPSLEFLPPLARIDYVFHNEAFQAVEARVWPESGGSDHRPLYVELALIAD